MMALLRNIGLFFVVYLPALALASMLMQLIPAVAAQTPPELEMGWNPILWLIATTPWQVPNVVFVPVLHLLAVRVARRSSTTRARRVLLVAAPAMFLLGNLALWGIGNLTGLVLPVLVGGAVYGAVIRIAR